MDDQAESLVMFCMTSSLPPHFLSFLRRRNGPSEVLSRDGISQNLPSTSSLLLAKTQPRLYSAMVQVDMPDAPREAASPRTAEARPTTEMEDFQQQILKDLAGSAEQEQCRRDSAGDGRETAARRSNTLDEKRPELSRAGTSLSEGQAPYAAIRAMTAGDADSVDVAAPGGSTHPDLGPQDDLNAKPTVRT